MTVETLLQNHELEVADRNRERRAAYESVEEIVLATRVIPAKDVSLIRLIVGRVDVVQGEDLRRSETGRRVLVGSTGQGLWTEARI